MGRILTWWRLLAATVFVAASMGIVVGSAAASAPRQTPPTTNAPAASCAAAHALASAGDLDGAAKAYSALLNAEPSDSCATRGLRRVRALRIREACTAGDNFADAHDDDSAKASYQQAVRLAGQTGSAARCATNGLESLDGSAAQIAPAWWSRAQHRVVQWATGLLWAAAGFFLIWLVVAFVTGWTVRIFNRIRPRSELVHLVPRVRLIDLDAGANGSAGAGLTPLLRGQMRSVQTADRLQLDFFRADSAVAGMVTSVKDIDSKLAAWIGLFSSMRRAWPWRSLVIDGQTLPRGRYAEGVSLSIVEGAREPSAVDFWRCPTGDATADEGDGKDQRAAQRYYDLVPAAASWAVYEAARVGGTSTHGLTEVGAKSLGYLAAGYALSSDLVSDAAAFYDAAVSADPSNYAARLAQLSIAEPTMDPLEERIDRLRVLLFEAWISHWPSLTQPIWGVPSE